MKKYFKFLFGKAIFVLDGDYIYSDDLGFKEAEVITPNTLACTVKYLSIRRKIRLSRFSFKGAKVLKRTRDEWWSGRSFYKTEEECYFSLCYIGLKKMLGCKPRKIYYKIVE